MRRFFIATIFVFLFARPVWATDWKEWPVDIGVPPDKVWTIKFSQQVDKATINSTNIYVTDYNGNLIPTNVLPGVDGKSATVDAEPNYSFKFYNLYISDAIKTPENKPLKNPTKLNFWIFFNNDPFG